MLLFLICYVGFVRQADASCEDEYLLYAEQRRNRSQLRRRKAGTVDRLEHQFQLSSSPTLRGNAHKVAIAISSEEPFHQTAHADGLGNKNPVEDVSLDPVHIQDGKPKEAM